MERHFILPATIAAALHAGLLFGIRSGHHDKTAAAGPIGQLTEIIQRFEILPEPPEPSDDAVPKPKGEASEAPPSLEERPRPLSATDFPIEIPRHDPNIKISTDTIPHGPVGDPLAPDFAREIGQGIIRLVDLDNVPRTRLQSAPIYPPEARRAGLNGEVTVEFTVDESGAVTDARAVRSSDRIFEEAAVRAVARWKFEPGLRGNRPVRFRMAVPIVFKLDEN